MGNGNDNYVTSVIQMYFYSHLRTEVCVRVFPYLSAPTIITFLNSPFPLSRYDTLLVILFSLLLAFLLATLTKWWRFLSALGSSSRKRILKSSSNLDSIKMEGFMQVRDGWCMVCDEFGCLLRVDNLTPKYRF